MKVRRQDYSCLFFYYAGFSRMREFVFRALEKPTVRILVFHDVSSRLAASFRAQIGYLKEKANIAGLNDILEGRISFDRPNVAVTFDDGHRSWIDIVAPALEEFGVSATFFVSSGFIGLRSGAEAEFERNKLKRNKKTTGSLSVEGLKKLVEMGFTIGGHTRNHVNLAAIRGRDELLDEIIGDKQDLERLTGGKVEYFSYPFGIYRNERFDLAEVLKEAGYRGAVTVVSGPNAPGANAYLLRRDIVDASMPLPVFKARLHGNQDATAFLRKLLRMERHTPSA